MSNTKARWFRGAGTFEGPVRPGVKAVPYRNDYYRDRGRYNRANPRLPYKQPRGPRGPVRQPKVWPGGLPPYPDGTPRRNPDGTPRPMVRQVEERAARALTRDAERLGKRALRVGFGQVLPFMDAVDAIDDWLHPRYDLAPILPEGYYWCAGPYPYYAKWTSKPYLSMSGTCSISHAYPGQALVPAPVPPAMQQGYPPWYYTRDYYVNDVIGSMSVVMGTVARSIGYPGPDGPVEGPAWSSFGPDPNIIRISPGTLSVGFGTTVEPVARTGLDPQGELTPDSPYEADHAWIFDVPTGYSGSGQSGGSTRPPVRPPAPAGRRPPPPGEYQSKVITKSAKVGIALYRALDRASESAEVVDAIYQALPADVRKRWERGRSDRPGDNFGQYGLSGADWKLQALWYNWDKVDPVEAVRNIIKNELTDRIIGMYQRVAPRNSGLAHEAGEREFAKWLDDYLAEELGL